MGGEIWVQDEACLPPGKQPHSMRLAELHSRLASNLTATALPPIL
jgi:hypothetical protein